MRVLAYAKIQEDPRRVHGYVLCLCLAAVLSYALAVQNMLR